MCGMDIEEIDLESIAMGKKMKSKPMSMPEKKTKIADRMEQLERFALRTAECKAISGEVKNSIKEHVRMIREILAAEYIK